MGLDNILAMGFDDVLWGSLRCSGVASGGLPVNVLEALLLS